jgi:site-specific DNA-methyltransferase (adenine-specific)
MNKLNYKFEEQILRWWKQKKILNNKIVSQFYDKKTNAFNISINFKMSLQSLIDKPKELLELINECLKPKVTEKHDFGEVFTPMWFVEKMLNDLAKYYMEKYNKNIWEQKDITFYDPAVGMGNFMIAIYNKLMDGLKEKIKDEKKRKKYIIEKILYMSEYSKKNCYVLKQIFDVNNEYKVNLFEGDSLSIDIEKQFGIKKFDIIIGNPPYNKKLTKVGALPYYNEFIEYYIEKSKILTYVVPSRWFAGGKGLDKFRKMMLKRNDIYYIKHFDNASEIFGNSVNIEGGINYFLKDINHNGLCEFNSSYIKLDNFDILVDSKYYDIINKIQKFDSITNIYLGRYFGIESNDKKLTNNDKLIKCYVSKQKGFTKYIDNKYIKKDFNFFKIITARANGSCGCFGNIFIGTPEEIHTGSYISFKVNNKTEAESLFSYLNCKLPNFLLSLRKISQDISESTCKWIPLPPLNKIWTDDAIYLHFKLTKNNINLIKTTKIKGYIDTIQKITKNKEKTKTITIKNNTKK